MEELLTCIQIAKYQWFLVAGHELRDTWRQALWRDHSRRNTLRPKHNSRHFADDIFQMHFV